MINEYTTLTDTHRNRDISLGWLQKVFSLLVLETLISICFMDITTEQVKQLREMTGVSIMQCRAALEEAQGDLEKAATVLAGRSGASALKKAGRELKAGAIGSYTHDGNIGAMVLLGSETDFVAKNPEFASLAKEIAMQVAAMAPQTTDDLLKQPFIKDASKTTQDLLNEATQKFGERVEIADFARLSAR